MLVVKLRGLGVVRPLKGQGGGVLWKKQLDERSKTIIHAVETYADKAWKVLGEVGKAIWIQLKEREVLSGVQSLNSSLVGRWWDLTDPVPYLGAVKKWAIQ